VILSRKCERCETVNPFWAPFCVKCGKNFPNTIFDVILSSGLRLAKIFPVIIVGFGVIAGVMLVSEGALGGLKTENIQNSGAHLSAHLQLNAEQISDRFDYLRENAATNAAGVSDRAQKLLPSAEKINSPFNADMSQKADNSLDMLEETVLSLQWKFQRLTARIASGDFFPDFADFILFK
jgi:hypothetical protein